MENGQLAFRVRPRKQVQPSQHTFTVSDAYVHTRKPHNKSRGGCSNCKQRRKKCDEGKPTCKRCSERNLSCQYHQGPLQRKQRNLINPSPPTGLWPGARTPSVLALSLHGSSYTDYDLFLLDHFVRFTALSIAGDVFGPVYTVQALDIANECAFLMHGMLALAACHLQHLCKDVRRYRVVEALHTQRASQGLCNAVLSFEGPRETDAVLTTSMLLNTLALCYGSSRYESEYEDNVPNWEWIRILLGIKDLLIQTRPFHPQSIWFSMFMLNKNFTFTEDPINNLDRRLVEFIGIDESYDPDLDPYHEFYEQLAPVVTRTPSVQYLAKYINAVGGMSYPFVDLLEAQDTKALVLFAHWLGLMCSVSHWWVARKTKEECWKICRILRGKLEEGDMDLLELPVTACGFRDM